MRMHYRHRSSSKNYIYEYSQLIDNCESKKETKKFGNLQSKFPLIIIAKGDDMLVVIAE